MWEKEHTEQDWEMLSLERPACRLAFGWHLKKDGFGEGSHQSQNWDEGSLCLNCETNMVDDEHLFSFTESGIWASASQRVPVRHLPIKSLGTESLMNFPGRTHFTYCHTSLLGTVSMSCVTPLEEDSWKLVPGSLWSLPSAPLHGAPVPILLYILLL